MAGRLMWAWLCAALISDVLGHGNGSAINVLDVLDISKPLFKPYDPVDPPLTKARLHITPLDGAQPVWWLFPPFNWLADLLGHTHVIVTNEGYPGVTRPFYRCFEFHPKAPPILKFYHGIGRIDYIDSPGWRPIHRQNRMEKWDEVKVLPGRHMSSIEQFNTEWGTVYDMSNHNCQQYSVELMLFLTGKNYRPYFLLDSVPTIFIILVFLLVGSACSTTCVLCGFFKLERWITRRTEEKSKWGAWEMKLQKKRAALASQQLDKLV